MAHVRLRFTSRYDDRPFVADVMVKPSFQFQPVVVFAHGMNGFKDWGPFPAMAEMFADAGIALCRFNFSHNGTTVEAPTDFEDLEAYQRNTVSIELSDLEQVLHFFAGGKSASEGAMIDKRRIGLMGHSRGGSVCLLESARNTAVKALVTLSAPVAFDRSPEEVLVEWENTGVRHIPNRRTGQMMPLGYNLVKDLEENAGRLDVLRAANAHSKPWLLMHGEADETVPLADALELSLAQPGARTILLPKEGHTYGAKHPHQGSLPVGFDRVTREAIQFFKEVL